MLFFPFAGRGLGTFDRSRQLISDGSPAGHSLGLSQEQVSVNVANGNLAITTTDLTFSAPGLDNNLLRTYNSQQMPGWRLSAIPQLHAPEIGAATVEYVHADGHYTTFMAVGDGSYEAWWPEVGRVTLVETEEGDWELSILQRGISKCFTPAGFLHTITSWDNGRLTYKYNAAQQLITVIDSANNTLSLQYTGAKGQPQTIEVFYNNKLYSTYFLDHDKRLTRIARVVESGTYNIYFAYAGLSSRVNRITQDDGTTLNIVYTASEGIYKVSAIGSEASHLWQLHYQPGVTTITAPEGESEQWHYDLASLKLHTHERYSRQTSPPLTQNLIYRTRYTYAAHEYLARLTETDGTETAFEYDAVTGWRTQKTTFSPGNPSAVSQEKVKYNEVGRAIEITLQKNAQSSTDIQIYAADNPHLLCFLIDGNGQVIERRYYPTNQCNGIYTYFTEPYKDEHSLSALIAWAKEIPLAQIAIETFVYHPNGKLKQRQFYIDNNSANVRQWDYAVNEFGLIIQTAEPALPNGTRPTSTAHYDELKRLTTSTNAANRTTNIAYQSAGLATPYQQITITPAQAVETKMFNKIGKIGHNQITATDIHRADSYEFNRNDQILAKTDHLGRVTRQLYDVLGRDAGFIDALGYVTFIYRDHRNRETYRHCPKMSIAQNARELHALSKQEISRRLQNLRLNRNNEEDVEGWTVYDTDDRPLFKIDTTGAVKEFHYGLFTEPEFIIGYANRIDVNQLPATPTVDDIKTKLTTDAERDHFTRNWLDNEGRKTGQLVKTNATEYRLIEWQYYQNGLIVKQKEYENKVIPNDPWKDTLDSLRPNGPVITTRIYYNLAREEVATVKHVFLTEQVRDNRGDAIKIIKYYLAVSQMDLPLAELKPVPHTEDWHTAQTFDGLHRVIARLHPNGRKETFAYQDTDKPINHLIEDIPLPHETRQKHAVGETRQVNALEETTNQLLPDGVDYFYREANEAQAWEVYGRHYQLDAAGRPAVAEVRISQDPNETQTHKEINYFDERNQTRFHVGAIGEIKEQAFDHRGNVLTELAYANRVSPEQFKTLTGGPLTSEIQQYFESLRDPANDRLTRHYYRGKRCIATQQGNGQWILYHHDAYGNVTHTAEQLTSTDWRMTIQHYDNRNIETAKKQIGIRLKIEANHHRALITVLFASKKSSAYEVFEERFLMQTKLDTFGRAEEMKDGNGVVIKNDYDAHHRLINQYCQDISLAVYVYDAHDRLIYKALSRNEAHQYAYITKDRTQIIVPTQVDYENKPIRFEPTWLTLDAFDQTVVKQTDGNKQLFEYEAYGNHLWTQEANGEKTTYFYHVGGHHWCTHLPSNYSQHHLLDAAYRYYHMVEYSQNDAPYEMHDYTHTLNTFGDILHTKKTDRSGTLPSDCLIAKEIAYDYDKRSQLISTTEDPSNTKRLTNFQRRLNGAVLQETISDANAPLTTEPDRTQIYELDSFDREKSSIIDPLSANRQQNDNLHLKTTYAYDAGDTPIAIMDANGFTSYTITSGNKRAKLAVDPQGRGIYSQCNANEKLILERRLTHVFTSEEIQAIRTESYTRNLPSILLSYFQPNDLTKQWIYDARQVLRYEISAGYRVIEHRYNSAAQKVQTIKYATQVAAQDYPYTLTTLPKVITSDSKKDETTYFILEPKGRPEYEIDSEGYLTYQKHDTYGNVQEKTRYAQKLPEGIDFTQVGLGQARQYAAERENNPKNRTDINFYSIRKNAQNEHLLRFIIDSLGHVTQYQYDIHHNPIREITYYEPGNITEFRQFTFAQMAKWCETYDNNPIKHRAVDETKFDALNRKTAVIDAENKTATYKNDIFGNPEEYQDKASHLWKNKFDRAGRKIEQRQPLRDVTHTTPNKTTKKLEAKHVKTEVTTRLTPDKLGQITQTIEGAGLPDERQFTHEFNESREQHTDILHNVPVYHPEKDTDPKAGNDRSTFEAIENLKDQIIFNVFGWPTIIVHRDGNCTYKVFSGDLHPKTGEPEVLYTIMPNGAVTGNQYDAFGNNTETTQYDQPIKINQADYPQGLTLTDIEGDGSDENPGLLIKTPGKDRTITRTFDRLQRQTAEVFPETIFANGNNENKPQNDERFYKLAVRKDLTYGAFPEPIQEVKFTNPFQSIQPTIRNYYDNEGRLIASIRPKGYLTEYRYDREGNNTYKLEYNNPCAESTTDTYLPPARHQKDREIHYVYDDKNRQIITEEYPLYYRDQYFNGNINNPPTFSDEKAVLRSTVVFYDANDNPIITVKFIADNVTREPQQIISLDISLYSPINQVFAHILPSRISYKAGTHERQEFVPLIGYEQDSHGRTVLDRVYAQSLNLEIYDQFRTNLFVSLKNAPQDLAQRDALIQQAYALATPDILESMKDDTKDRITLRQYDHADNAIAECGPSGLTQYSSYTHVPQQVAKRWWFDKVWDTNLRDRLQEPTLKDQPWVMLAKYDAAGLQIRIERWAGDEHHVERYVYNLFHERERRGGEDEQGNAQWQEIWMHDPLGQIHRTNASDGVWKYNLYQPGVQEPSLIITSPSVDLSSERANDLRWIMNQPAYMRRELWTLFNEEGQPTERQYPPYSTTKPAPNVALRHGKQTGELQEDFGNYAIVFNRPANFGTHAKLFVRVVTPINPPSSPQSGGDGRGEGEKIHQEPEWIALEIKSSTDGKYFGATIDNLITDNYEYRLELYHMNDTEPYSEGAGKIALETPIKEGSTQLVGYVDPDRSFTAIQLTGKTTDDKAGTLTGIRVYVTDPAEDSTEADEPIAFLGVTPDEDIAGNFSAEARAVPRGDLLIGRADITRPIGPPIYPQPPAQNGKINKDSAFIIEVSTEAILYSGGQDQIEIVEEPWTPQPDEIFPCFDPTEEMPHTDHTNCEKPTFSDEASITRNVLKYRHYVDITVNVTGIPVHSNGAIAVFVKLRCQSGKTISVPAKIFSGSAIASAKGARQSNTTLKFRTMLYEFIKADPKEDWNGNPYPPKTDLDYPSVVEQVSIEGYTTIPSEPQSLSPEDVFPLYQKAPNAQTVYINDKQQPIEKNLISQYPQRTLFIPQHLIKFKGTKQEDKPIAVRIANKQTNYAPLSTIALNTIANPHYKTVNISTLSAIIGELEIQPVGSEPIAFAFPEPVDKSHWVDTRPYNSRIAASEPFNPEPNPITDSYFSDMFVDFIYTKIQNTSSYCNYFVLSNFTNLPDEIHNLILQGKSVVKVHGYWRHDPTQEVEILIPFRLQFTNDNVEHVICNNDKLLVPTNIEISTSYNNVNYLLYDGLGENHYYNSPGLPDRLNMPHHSLYGFITKYPEIKTTYVEARKKSNNSLITTLPIIPAVHWAPYCQVKLPADVKPTESYFVPKGEHTQQINPIISNYYSDLHLVYKQTLETTHVMLSLYNTHSLPDYIGDPLRAGKATINITGYRQGQLGTWNLNYYIHNVGDIRYYKFNPDVNLRIDVTNISISVVDSKYGVTWTIYAGLGDEYHYLYYNQVVDSFVKPHYSYYFFRTTQPRIVGQVTSVQLLKKDTHEYVTTLPIDSPFTADSSYDALRLPAEIEMTDGTIVKLSDCDIQPVGPAFVQPYPIQANPVTVLSYNHQKIHLAESRCKVTSKISSQMYWTRYDEHWSDIWNGDKYRWEGLNCIKINVKLSPDLQEGNFEVKISYWLDSYYGVENGEQGHRKLYSKTFARKDMGVSGTFDVYSPYTSSQNAPAKLVAIESIQIINSIDNQRVIIYGSTPPAGVPNNHPNGEEHLLYLTPLTIDGEDENPALKITHAEFKYRAKDSGQIGLWQTLPVTVAGGAAYINSNSIPIGHYEYQLRAYNATGEIVDLKENCNHRTGVDGWVRGEFNVARHQGVVVPEADLTKKTVQPKEFFENDPWNNPIAHTDVRGATRKKNFDRDNQITEEQDPDIEVMVDEPHLLTPPPAFKYAVKIINNEAELNSLPKTLVRCFQPVVNVKYISPPLIQNGKYKNDTNRNSALLKIKVHGLNDLPFTQYQLKLKWITKDGQHRHHLFIWTLKENDHRYNNTQQIPLNIIREAQNKFSFDTPNAAITYTLEACIKEENYILVKDEPATYFMQLENRPNQAPLVLHDHTQAGTTTLALYKEPASPPKPSKSAPKDVTEKLLTKTTPTTHIYRDANGHELGRQHPNGTIWPIVHDGTGQTTIEYAPTSKEEKPTGYIRQLQEQNNFAETINTENATGKITTLERNQAGHIERITHPDNQTETQLHNAQGQLLQHTDPLGHSSYTQPGLDNRTIAQRNADDIVIRYRYQPETGKLILTACDDNTSHAVKRDYWGTELGGHDRAGVPYHVEHDLTKQPLNRTSQTQEEGPHHGYDITGKLVPGQSLYYSYYTDGRLFQILDAIHHTLIQMEPEIGGAVARRRVMVENTHSASPGLQQDLITTRNLLGWIIQQSDIHYAIATYYDVEGNKRELRIQSRHPETLEPLNDDTQVFTYGSDGTVLTSRARRNEYGELEWNTTTHETAVSEYFNGQQLSLTFYRRYSKEKAKYVKEVYEYSERDIQVSIIRDDDTWREKTLDAASRVTQEDSYDFQGEDYELARRSALTTLSPAGQMLNQTNKDFKEGLTTKITQDKSTDRAPDGTLLHTFIKTTGGDRDITNDITREHINYTQPQEHIVKNKQTIAGFDPTIAVGTTYYGTSGELKLYQNDTDPDADKAFVSTFLNHVHVAKEGNNMQHPDRVVYSFLDEEGKEVARFERDKNREDLPTDGQWTFDMTNRSTTVAPWQGLPAMQTVTEGTTLLQLAGGNQELLWLLQEANPGISPSQPLPAGTQIHIPGVSQGARHTAQNHGWTPNVSSMLGNTIPEAPLPLLPEIDRYGGLKNYFPMMVGTAVAIAVSFMVPGGQGIGYAMLNGGLTFMASNASAQITAQAMGLTEGGFNFGAMLESGAMGAVMGAAQFQTRNIGLNILGGGQAIESSAWKTASMAMTQQAVAQAVQGAFAGKVDFRSVVSNILAAGATSTLLQQAGFNEGKYDDTVQKPTDNSPDAFNNVVDYTVQTLGNGFLQTAIASGLSGQPMNSNALLMNTLTQIAIKIGAEAVKAATATSSKEPEQNPFGLSEENYYTMTLEEQAAFHLRGHRRTVPNQAATTKTDENGYNISREAPVPPPSANKNVSPQKQKEFQKLQANAQHKANFENGNAGLKQNEAHLSVYDHPSKPNSSYFDILFGTDKDRALLRWGQNVHGLAKSSISDGLNILWHDRIVPYSQHWMGSPGETAGETIRYLFDYTPTVEEVEAFMDDPLMMLMAYPDKAILTVVSFHPGKQIGKAALKNADSVLVYDASANMAKRAYLNDKFGRSGNLNHDIMLRGYMQQVESLDIVTAPNSAVFYSGSANKQMAEEFSRTFGKTTLEMTKGGNHLQNQAVFEYLPPALAIKPWANLSANYAKSATGDVFVYGTGAKNNSILKTVEIPTLLENPNVTSINYRQTPYLYEAPTPVTRFNYVP